MNMARAWIDVQHDRREWITRPRRIYTQVPFWLNKGKINRFPTVYLKQRKCMYQTGCECVNDIHHIIILTFYFPFRWMPNIILPFLYILIFEMLFNKRRHLFQIYFVRFKLTVLLRRIFKSPSIEKCRILSWTFK